MLRESAPKYDTFERLSQGSYGVVHRIQVNNQGIMQQYALKEIELHNDKLKDELQGVLLIKKMQLQHENLVECYDMWFNVDEVRMYIMMEYCDNASLNEYTSRCTELPDELQAANWFLQIAKGTQVSSVHPTRITAILST